MKRLLVVLITSLSLYGLAQDVVYIEPGANVNNSTTITVIDGDVENNSGTPLGGTLELHATTGNNYSFSSTAPNETLTRLEITGDGEIDLLSNIEISDAVLLGVNAILDLGTANILLDPAASIMGETNSAHIKGDAGSYIEITKDHTSAAVPELFGNIGFEIDAADAALGNTTIYRRYGQLTIDGNTSFLRYYDIQPTNTSPLNVSARFYFTDADLDGADPATGVLYRSEDGAGGWDARGGIYSATDPYSLILNGINSFSVWAIVANDASLPVELVFFDAEAVNNEYVLCTWQTASEQDNSYFDVERSQNGNQFDAVGQVLGAGTTNQTQNYDFEDPAPFNGTSFYRLKQVDFDGTFEYSAIRQVYIEKESGIVLFPNPAIEVVHVTIPKKTGYDTYNVYDIKGALMMQGKMPTDQVQLDLDVTLLASGAYVLDLVNSNSGKRKAIKFIKQ